MSTRAQRRPRREKKNGARAETSIPQRRTMDSTREAAGNGRRSAPHSVDVGAPCAVARALCVVRRASWREGVSYISSRDPGDVERERKNTWVRTRQAVRSGRTCAYAVTQSRVRRAGEAGTALGLMPHARIGLAS